jgi:hypothetical protein
MDDVIEEILEDNLLCCFCDETIESDQVNPCELIVKSNWDKPRCEQGDQVFFTHFKCLKERMGVSTKPYLVIDIIKTHP